MPTAPLVMPIAERHLSRGMDDEGASLQTWNDGGVVSERRYAYAWTWAFLDCRAPRPCCWKHAAQ